MTEFQDPNTGHNPDGETVETDDSRNAGDYQGGPERTTRRPAKRLLIVGGHVRPEPDIQSHEDERTGRTIIDSETHFVPTPVHFAFDPATGQVYAGTTENEALGITEDDQEG